MVTWMNEDGFQTRRLAILTVIFKTELHKLNTHLDGQ